MPVRHLNYGQLRQFHEVASAGSVTAAAERLHVTPQTISGQIRQLEGSVGEPLFERVGRGLALTATGRLVHEYSERLFAIGEELATRLRDGDAASERLRIGLVDAVPKLVACSVLLPLLDTERQHARDGDGRAVRLHCIDGSLDTLLGQLAARQLDLVLSDRPIPEGSGLRASTHVLGEGAIGFYAAAELAATLRDGFPESLHGAPVLLPEPNNALRRRLDTWLDTLGIEPRIVAEIADSSLMKTIGDAGVGAFPSPVSMRSGIARSFHAELIGTCDGVSEQLIAIAPERRLRHPAVIAIADAARDAFG